MATERQAITLSESAQANTPRGAVASKALAESAQSLTGGGGATTTYSMRALADPGPGFVFWTATTRDYSGAGAGQAIQAGTAVVLASVTS